MSKAVSLTGRYFNAACYGVSGIFLLAASSGSAWTILFGIAAIGYALYIAFTRASYWVSTWTYLVPVLLIIVAIVKMQNGNQ